MWLVEYFFGGTAGRPICLSTDVQEVPAGVRIIENDATLFDGQFN